MDPPSQCWVDTTEKQSLPGQNGIESSELPCLSGSSGMSKRSKNISTVPSREVWESFSCSNGDRGWGYWAWRTRGWANGSARSHHDFILKKKKPPEDASAFDTVIGDNKKTKAKTQGWDTQERPGRPRGQWLDGHLSSPNASPTLRLCLELYCGVSEGRDGERTTEWEQQSQEQLWILQTALHLAFDWILTPKCSRC